ncbi:nucleotide-diphospho-sugar transferase [Polyplosphaeria fusca]|uniref:Nucleotide-diphospho-sugar transferase n=1 Tax=Polyplosphaeria fusca TaxID=682080 RepID=A0A9P4QTK2_9PLEO|nr:nucleotide-diphospho-sugar transferase [Polyplosphaeria fusca]
MSEQQSRYAYVTLLTRPSYLAGAIILAYSLHKHSPSTPLIIIYTPSTLGPPAIRALESESPHTNLILRPVSPLSPAPAENSHDKSGSVAERFTDTWTKLCVFTLTDTPFSHLCFLDADTLILRNPSPTVFSVEVQEKLSASSTLLMATHICVCNLDGDAWAPDCWTPQNCAFTRLTRGSGPAAVDASHATLGAFNSGVMVFAPSTTLAALVMDTFASTPADVLSAMQFPDQDFLNMVLRGRWGSLGWEVNALKTWRYWHGNVWEDGEVRVLHYIVDKPWARRVDGEGRAGYKGWDGVTHGWWWGVYEEWRREREGEGDGEVVRVVERWVDGGEGEAELGAVGGKAQDWARRWEDVGEKNEQDGEKHEDGTYGQGPHGPVLRKPMLGERGHGAVVREHALKGPGKCEMD